MSTPVDDYPNTLEQYRYVRVMLDYCSTGLWDKEGCNVEVSDATADPKIIEMLKNWQHAFERLSSDAVLTTEEISKQQLDGLLIAMLLHQQHPDWQVVLWDGEHFFKDGERTPDGRNLIVNSARFNLKIYQ